MRSSTWKMVAGGVLSAAVATGCAAEIDPIGAMSQAVLVPPDDGQFTAFLCDGGPSFDTDEPGNGNKALDLVGDATYPLMYRAADSTYLYLRMRVDDDPLTGASDLLDSKSWGFLIDSDDDHTSFEYLVHLNGISDDVAWEQNDTQSPANDPGDTTRTVLETYAPGVDFWHVKATGDGSSFGGDTDYFITVAVKISNLTAAGISLEDSVNVWAATSTNNSAFDHDLSCEDDETLDGHESDEEPLISCSVDTDGDGVCDQLDPCPMDNPDDPDGDGICQSDDDCPLDNPNDTDGDGVCDSDDDCPLDNPDDTDGDGVCDSDDPCPLDNPDDSDSDGICDSDDTCVGGDDTEDVDGDGRCDADDNCVDEENADQLDSDGDDIGNVCDTCPYDADNDVDSDGVCGDEDNCPDDSNGDQIDTDGDGMGDACDPPDEEGNPAFGFTGGGCAAGGTGGLDMMLLLGLLLLLGFVSRRRRGAARIVVALAVLAGAGQARAQTEAVRSFPVERFRLTTTENGLFNVEWGKVPTHLSWSVSAWAGNSDDPLVAYDATDPDRRRIGSVVDSRVGGALGFSLALFERLAVGLTMPLVLHQSGDDIAGLDNMPPLSGGGLGDLQVGAKVALAPVSMPIGVAIRVALSLPTASSDEDFLGEDGAAFTNELIVSHAFGRVRAALNVGTLIRSESRLGDLIVDDELYFRAGLGFAATDELEIAATLTESTSLSDPFQAENQGVLDGLLGATYRVQGPLSLFVAGGAALNEGVGGPDWRLLGGARLGSEGTRDDDGDGIENDEDSCPLVAEDRDGFQDRDGCPDPDNDQDKILDADDGAPMEPEDHDGFQDEDGIPDPDNDGDGIDDTSDNCPNDPETENGFEDDDGCPDEADPDGDGIRGEADACPEKPEDVDTFEDGDGCPDLDNDSDGVLDVADACPVTAGPVENKGCPDTDRDGDTVVDRLDNCPDEPGSVKNHGCKRRQLVKITPTKLVIVGKVLFASGKAKIRGRSNRLLNNVAAVMNAHPEIEQVLVEGHTDDRGKDEFNMNLSQRRADAVVKYLTNKGVAEGRLRAKGFGETTPIETNKTRAGRSANRRVEFTIETAGAEATVEPPSTSAAPAAATEAPGIAPAAASRPNLSSPQASPTTPKSPPLATSLDLGDSGRSGAELTPNDVIEKYQSSGFAIRRCYERALKSDPTLDQPRADVTVTVGLNGRATAKIPNVKNAQLVLCLQTTIRSWQFPKPKSPLRVQLTMLFKAP